MKRLTRTQDRVWELRLIRRIGEVLRLQAESVAMLVRVTVAADRAIEEVAGIELHSGLRGRNFQDASGRGFVNARGQDQARTFAVDHEIVVVSMGKLELFVVVIDAGADLLWFGEIERRSLYRFKFSRRNQMFVHRCKAVGIDHDLVIEDVAIAFALQIEVAVIGQIDGSGFVGGRFVVDHEFIGVAEGVSHSDFQVAGKSVVAIFAQVVKDDSGFALHRLGVPHDFIESVVAAAVQGIRAIVLGQSVSLAFETEGAVGDAVRVASDERSKVRRVGKISLKILVAKDDVSHLALAVGHADADDNATVVHGLNFDAVRIRKCEQRDRPPILRAKRLGADSGTVFRQGKVRSSQRKNKSDEK